MAALPGTEEKHPLLSVREVNKSSVVHITPDRGLCGGLNANLNRKLAGFVLEQNGMVEVIAVGRKGRDFAHRSQMDLEAEFSNLGDQP